MAVSQGVSILSQVRLSVDREVQEVALTPFSYNTAPKYGGSIRNLLKSFPDLSVIRLLLGADKT